MSGQSNFRWLAISPGIRIEGPGSAYWLEAVTHLAGAIDTGHLLTMIGPRNARTLMDAMKDKTAGPSR